MASESSVVYDPWSHELHEDPYPTYTQLREEQPVYYNEARDFYALSRYQDVLDALHDPATYCSGQGVLVGQGDGGMAVMPGFFVMSDPPRHGQLRALVSRAFTPRRIADMESSIREIARACLDQMAGEGVTDLVQSLAAPLPTTVIADLLGVSRTDLKQFREWSDALVQIDPAEPENTPEAIAASLELLGYLGTVVAERRASPRDDMVSALLDAEVDGERLADEEIVGFCVLLLVAGNETTTNLISNSTVLLAAHPDQRAQLAGDPALLPGAIEEFLRYESPVQALARTLTRDVTLHGQRMEEGRKVVMVFGAANRDPREFTDPDRLDVTRGANRHLGFGHGIHFCLGASLARLEARVAFEELLARFPFYELAVTESQLERVHSGAVRGLVSLPVTVG